MTVWYQKCKCSITQIKWCQLYFEDTAEKPAAKKEGEPQEAPELGGGPKDPSAQFSARICEFFAID